MVPPATDDYANLPIDIVVEVKIAVDLEEAFNLREEGFEMSIIGRYLLLPLKL